jgi:murein endopeptidase
LDLARGIADDLRMRPLATVAACLAFATASSAHAARHHARLAPRAAHTHAGGAPAAHAVAVREPQTGQSIGVPWAGHLREPARLPPGDGYVIRRPGRSFGTRQAVDLIGHVLTLFHREFPDTHVLAIGDLSAEHGGPITEHHSHQSGRDADIGLVYKQQPVGYPESFVAATETNLDCDATLAIIRAFARTAHEDGGAQTMFLDYDVQGILVRWGQAHGVDDKTLGLFQYPHGRGYADALVRHVPNHANHVHVRFQCASDDRACR